jgi:hypothetical protein
MRKALVVGVMSCALAGCAGSIVGDAIRGPEALAQEDDRLCRSLGVEPPSKTYYNCRQAQMDRREASHARGAALMATGAAIAATPPPAPALAPVQQELLCTPNPTYGGMQAPSMTCR